MFLSIFSSRRTSPWQWYWQTQLCIICKDEFCTTELVLILLVSVLSKTNKFTKHFWSDNSVSLNWISTSEVSLVAQTVKNLSAMQENWVQSLGWEDPLEKKMATHSSVLAWRIPWTEGPGGLQSIGLQRVRYDRVTHTFTFITLEPVQCLQIFQHAY